MFASALVANLCCFLVLLLLPSVTGAVFLVAIWTISITHSWGRGGLFALLWISSLVVLLCKTSILILSFSPSYLVTLHSAQSLLFALGYRVSFTSIDLVGVVSTFAPEVVAFVTYLIAWRDTRLETIPKSLKFSGTLGDAVTIGLLFGLATYRCCWFALGYLILGFLYSLNIVYWRDQKRKYLLMVSWATTSQFLLAFLGRLLLTIDGRCGAYEYLAEVLLDFEYALVVCLYAVTYPQVESPEDKLRNLDGLHELLIRPTALPENITMLGLAWMYLKSVELTILILRVVVLLWVSRYQEYVSVALLGWIFLSVFAFQKRAVILKAITWVLVPTMVFSIGVHYICNLATFRVNPVFSITAHEMPTLDFPLQIAVFLWTLLTAYRLQAKPVHFPPKSESFRAILSEFLHSHSKVALSVLFLVGLSSIDLLHTPLLIICVMFAVNSDTMHRHWRMMLAYTMFALTLLYVWKLVLMSGYQPSEYKTLWRVIGFPGDISQFVNVWFVPDQFPLWILLFSGFAQLACYEHVNDYRVYELSKTNLLITCMLSLKTAILMFEARYEIWVMYTVLVTTMWISDQNILNFLRYLLLMILFVVHFTDDTLKRGQFKLRRYWFFFKYYCGLILVFRYVFQFSSIAGAISDDTEPSALSDLRLLGVELYDLSKLYKSMLSDLVLFVASALAGRALVHVPKQSEPLSEGWLFFSDATGKCVLLSIAMIAVFWRLAVSMLINLFCVVVYFCIAIFHYSHLIHSAFSTKSLPHHSPTLLSLRDFAWRALFCFCVLHLIVDYAVFVLNPAHMLQSEYDYAAWIMFAFGFTTLSSETSLIWEIYGYSGVFILLLIEKNCIELSRSGHPEEKHVTYTLNSSFQLWNHARTVLEELLLTGIILVAFWKLTIVSVIYVVCAFILCVLGVDNMYKLKYMAAVVAVGIVGQYGAILSNVNEGITPAKYPKIENKPFEIPWYPRVMWGDPKRDPTFYNLGTSLSQVHSISHDVLILFGILVYFKYFAEKRPDLTFQRTPDVPILPQSPQSQQSIWFSLKNSFYSSAHILVFILVLVFVSQSSGLSGLLYCCLSLLMLIEANTLLNFTLEWDRHMRLVKNFFLSFLMLDLSALIVYQTPVDVFHGGSWVELHQALGLVPLWNAGDSVAAGGIEHHFQWVVCKIGAFMFLRLLILMYSNEDFKEYINLVRSAIEQEAKNVCKRDIEKLDTARESAYQSQLKEKAETKKALRELLCIVSEWDEGKCDITTSTEKIQMCLRRPGEETGDVTQVLLRTAVEWINTSFFHEFVEELKRKPEEMTREGGEEEPEKTIIYPTFDRCLRLCLYLICSRTQEVCYMLFILNHLAYASLESMIFPLSLLFYAILESPRPPTNYWRGMMYYTAFVFCVKYGWQLQLWDVLLPSSFKNYDVSGMAGSL